MRNKTDDYNQLMEMLNRPYEKEKKYPWSNNRDKKAVSESRQLIRDFLNKYHPESFDNLKEGNNIAFDTLKLQDEGNLGTYEYKDNKITLPEQDNFDPVKKLRTIDLVGPKTNLIHEQGHFYQDLLNSAENDFFSPKKWENIHRSLSLMNPKGRTVGEAWNQASRDHITNLVPINYELSKVEQVNKDLILPNNQRKLINSLRTDEVEKLGSKAKKEIANILKDALSKKASYIPGIGETIAAGAGISAALNSGKAEAAIEPMTEVLDPTPGLLIPEKLGESGEKEEQLIENPQFREDFYKSKSPDREIELKKQRLINRRLTR